MCTLSVLPISDGAIIAMNRDERRGRAWGAELMREDGPPERVWPRDAEAGGTWFGMSAAGFVVALLNNYAAEAALEPRPTSRGLIPLRLMEAQAAAAARDAMTGLNLAEYRPFRVVIVEVGGPIFFGESDGFSLRTERLPWGPALFVSSGWSEAAVRAWREAAWGRLIAGDLSDPVNAIRRLHFQQDEHGAFGFSMSRPEAASRSYTEVQAHGRELVLRSWPEAPVDYGPRVAAALDASQIGVRNTYTL